MKRITSKITTLRRATASARINASADAITRMQKNDLPKKDVLIVARVAAVGSVKKTADLIPYCHPLPVDAVEIEFVVADTHVDITATVEAIWKTGVEMEAMTAASVAALTIYDMLKAVDKDMVIEGVRLVKKTGGKGQYRARVPKGLRAAVVVTSDSTHAGERDDRSGVLIKERLQSYKLDPSYDILPDDEATIVARLRELIEQGVDLIVTTGGTGAGPRDVTVEATRAIIERELPGVMEAARTFGQDRTPYAMLSRGVAGVSGQTVVINLPGSSRGSQETLDAIFPAIFHVFPMLKGMGH